MAANRRRLLPSTYCEEVEYNEPDEELLETMQQIWKGCDDSLWSHEWKKHGSCMKSQNNITENDLFNITLQLLDSYKFLLDINCNTKDDNTFDEFLFSTTIYITLNDED